MLAIHQLDPILLSRTFYHYSCFCPLHHHSFSMRKLRLPVKDWGSKGFIQCQLLSFFNSSRQIFHQNVSLINLRGFLCALLEFTSLDKSYNHRSLEDKPFSSLGYCETMPLRFLKVLLRERRFALEILIGPFGLKESPEHRFKIILTL